MDFNLFLLMFGSTFAGIVAAVVTFSILLWFLYRSKES